MCACTRCLETNFIPINENVSLNDPSTLYSGQRWNWANFFKIPHDYSLTQVPKPVFSKMCAGFYICTLFTLLKR